MTAGVNEAAGKGLTLRRMVGDTLDVTLELSSDSGQVQLREKCVRLLTVAGLALALVGVVAGAAIAYFGRQGFTCPGDTFPASETGRYCYDYPRLLEGATYALASLIAGVIVGLLGLIAAAVSKRQT